MSKLKHGADLAEAGDGSEAVSSNKASALKTYNAPRIITAEPLEVTATTCDNQPLGKSDAEGSGCTTLGS